MDHPENIDSLALDTCDQEPIHRPGCIQPFGALVAGPLDLSQAHFVSSNAEDILGVNAGDILGSPIDTLIEGETNHDLRNLLSMSTSRNQRERAGRMEIGGRMLEIFAHRNADNLAVLEFEPLDLFGSDSQAPIDRMRMILAQAANQGDLDQFLQVCVHGLRSLTRYDRVKAYRYTSNGDGEVVAESRAPQVESFLGLRYPAWDIPTQARALLVRSPVRMLSDINQIPTDLIGHGQDPDMLDLSLAHLRGVSPVHIQYLRNMGVGATLSIGLVVDGKLWGMFACHHRTPHLLRSDTRIAVELFGQMISLALQQKLEMQSTRARERAEKARRRILADTDAAADLLNAFPDLGPILRSVVASDGMALVRDDEIEVDGSVPGVEAIRAIGQRAADDDDLVEGTDSLAASGWAQGFDTGNSAGCLQIRCAATAPLQILFFRDEKTRNIHWAGKPEKDITPSEGEGWKLSPRASFSSYLEQQRHHAEPWDEHDYQAAKELQRLLMQITSKDERAQMLRHRDLITHQRQQDLMIAELNHRVKNILALIRSLSRQAKASSASLESYAHALEQRIAALAAAHDLAVSNTMQGVSLRNILETELKPYLAEDTMQVLLAGPIVGLRADVAPMIALVFHEIVTNANKYGALSTGDGVVKASWSVSEDGLAFSWREIGGPTVTAPTRHGFGQSLIEKAVPYEFDGTATLDFAPGGVIFSFTLPPDTLVDMEEESTARIVGRIGEIVKVATGANVLMVEDNIVLAMDMVESLTRLGAETVETAATVQEALRLLDGKEFDFAVLDMNLRGVVSFDIAHRLIERGVPFVFVTGYGSSMIVPASLAHVQVLTKPVDDGTLSASLGKLLAKG